MINIAVTDDHSLMLKKLVSILKTSSSCNIIKEASNGPDLIHFCNTSKLLPDIVLVDVHMPKMDGVAVTDYLYEYFPQVKVIGLSTYLNPEMVEDMIGCGAWGYLLKENLAFIPEVLQAVYHGKVYVDPSIDMLYEMNNTRRELLLRKRNYEKEFRAEIHLTKREFIFITLNATEMDYNEIGKIMFIQPRTVETMFGRLSKKLNLKNRQSLTLFSLRNGLVRIARFKKYASTG